jgi:dTMP kinase
MLYNEDRPAHQDALAGPAAGRLITFEGIDGSGKSSQISSLAESLRKLGRRVLTLREPGGTSIGEAIRLILLDRQNRGMSVETELLLFEAARAQLVREVIQPALQAGTWVICDRFYDSSLAYQGYGRGVDLETVARMNEFAVGGRRPDLTILLDLPAESAVRRLSGRADKADRLDGESAAFMQRIRQGYLEMAAQSNGRIQVLDAGLPEAALAQQIFQCVKEGLDL